MYRDTRIIESEHKWVTHNNWITLEETIKMLIKVERNPKNGYSVFMD